MTTTNGSWDENRKSVLGRLSSAERRLVDLAAEIKTIDTSISDKLSSLSEQVTSLRVDLAGWKGRLAAWGLIGAAVVSAVVAFVFEVFGEGGP